MTTPIALIENSPNFSGNLRSRLKARTLLFRYLAEINLILGAWYLQWRIGHSVNFNALWLAVPLLLAEIYSYIGGVMFTIGLWRPLVRQVRSLDQMMPLFKQADWSTVDIFITCYNEPSELVEQTARAALAIDYPVTRLRVYILDDGNSTEIRSMARKLGAEDLQSPLIQAEVQRITIERSQLLDRLEQIKQFASDHQAVEQLLQNSPPTSATVEIDSLQKTLLLLSPGQLDVQGRLIVDQQKIEAALLQKDRDLSALDRCRYIARPKAEGKPHHAKAGNINYAIFSGETAGDFILTLDADHICKPQFLKRVLPYFYTYSSQTGRYEGNRTAFVQTPQDFYNLPDGDPFGHQAHLFYTARFSKAKMD